MTFLIAPRFVGPCCPCTYVIENSVYGDGSTGYFSRTPGVQGDRRTFTWSAWVKITTNANDQTLWDADTSASGNEDLLILRSGGTLELQLNGGAGGGAFITNQLFRDVSAWQHILVAIDTTQATADDRIKLYVNGIQVTSFFSRINPSLNYQCVHWNNTVPHQLLKRQHPTVSSTTYWRGYATEMVHIDGQALDPTSFGEFDASGNWVPIDVSGLTFGTNGFLLDFSNGADLGEDSSGNGNDWATNGTITQTTDSPTDDAANDVGNFATWNPLDKSTTQCTLSNGNLFATTTTNGSWGVRGTVRVASGKWYFEVTDVTTNNWFSVGVDAGGFNVQGGLLSSSANGYCYISHTGNKGNNGIVSAYGSTYTSNDIIGVAVDLDNGAIWFSKNGTWQNSATIAEIEAGTTTNAAYTGLNVPGRIYTPAWVADTSSGSAIAKINTGQTALVHTVPTGFKPLCTANLPAPVIANGALYHDVHLRTGTGATATTTGIAFQPDLVWTKSRSNATNHNLFDAVRGVQKGLVSNSTSGEYTDANTLTAFTGDGYTYGSDSTPRGVNTNTHTYVDWLWKAGGAGSSNSDGSITCTLSVDQTAGISISTFSHPSGTGTIGHGLGVAPQCIITKSLVSGSWVVAHVGLTNMSNRFLLLDTTDAEATDSTYWNNTAPTSSVWSVGTGLAGSDRVAYCFAEVSGFSAFGKYTGNGSSDGPFVWCGFRPRYILTKRTDTTGDWWIADTAINPYNVATIALYADGSAAEENVSDNDFDILSNGFKLRSSSARRNASSGTYIYAAFAEHPFGGVGVSQARAR